MRKRTECYSICRPFIVSLWHFVYSLYPNRQKLLRTHCFRINCMVRVTIWKFTGAFAAASFCFGIDSVGRNWMPITPGGEGYWSSLFAREQIGTREEERCHIPYGLHCILRFLRRRFPLHSGFCNFEVRLYFFNFWYKFMTFYLSSSSFHTVYTGVFVKSILLVS